MKVWIDSLLFTSGVPLKSETLRVADPRLILDLRKRTERSHYYEVGPLAAKGCTFISLEIERGKVYHDTGRAVKDKNATMKRICQQIVDRLRGGEAVLIVCNDGMTTSGFIAIVVRWWYLYSLGKAEKDADIIKEVRDANDFTSARDKEQREQMGEIRKEALKIIEWEKKGFKMVKRRKVGEVVEEEEEENE
jgi:hypothetical protein